MLANFSVKGQTVNYLGYLGLVVSAILFSYLCTIKIAIGEYGHFPAKFHYGP